MLPGKPLGLLTVYKCRCITWPVATELSLVDKAISLTGGTQVALAAKFRECGYPTVKQAHVWQWRRSGKFPAEWAEAVQIVTAGKVKAAAVIKAAQRQRTAAA